jgi:CDP-glucose 4,6-dehydratase
MGTLNMYEAVRACDSVRVIVSITTDKCYENREWVWGYRENDPLGGYDPYSSSKGCAEILSSAYRRSYFNPEHYGKTHHVALATARAGNVIGGGDWAQDRLVPDCVRSLSKNEIIRIRSPHATRPWQHVLEPLSGYLLLAQRMSADGVSFSEAWNFGPGEDGFMDVENVVKNVISAWGHGHYEIASDADYHEAQLLKLDISKVRAKLGWKTVYSCEDAIKKSIEWYIYFYSQQNIKKITLAQINLYMEMGR